VCHLDIAEKKSRIPVVDFENFKSTYNETNPVWNTMNSFEYYFKPVSPYTLEYAYQARDYIISDNNHPSGYDFTLANIPGLHSIYCKYISLRSEVSDIVSNFMSDYFNSPVLGVHFRGKEMRTGSGHWYPPTTKQMLVAIERSIARFNYKRIFVSSEDKSLIDKIDRSFPGMVFYNTNYYRSSGNAYKEYPRPRHFYLLGLEVLVDMIALSKCDSLVSCSSNVAWFARFINNGEYKSHIFINNGPNFRRSPLRNISWYVRSILPEAFYGFRTNEQIIQETVDQ